MADGPSCPSVGSRLPRVSLGAIVRPAAPGATRFGSYKLVSIGRRGMPPPPPARCFVRKLEKSHADACHGKMGGGNTAGSDVDVFARRSEPATGQVQVFTRRASGLVRVMSPYSAFAYNILNIGVIFPWVCTTTIAFYPGASVWAGIVICGAFTSLLAVVYAGLASAMPRTGG